MIANLRPSSLPLFCLLCLAGASVRPAAAQVATAGAITGTVYDSTRAAPLAGAEVYLIGTTVTVATNDEGRFFVPDVAAGAYAISFRHARLELLGWIADGIAIEVKPGETVSVELAVPARPVARQVPIAAAVPPPLRQGSPSVIVGTVVDVTSGRGIGGAAVRVRDTPIGIVTDERGKFVLFDVPPGGRYVDVQMLGYAARATPVTAIPGATIEIAIPLSTRAIELDPVMVEIRSGALERVGFYEREEDAGVWGHFITPAGIERRAPARFTDLFTSIPGARVDYYGPGRSAVMFRRVTGSSSADGCAPDLFLDGMRIRGNWDFIGPTAIAGVEVYVGINAPIQYSTNPCGAVLVWTKRGG
jgi:hypothetical protein